MKKILLLLFFLCIKVKASTVVMDYDSKRIIYEEDMNKRMLIASTTKIMTSIIALENAPLDYEIIIGKEINSSYGSMCYIKENEKYDLNDLLHGLMLQSGNDCAISIASNIIPYDNFIAEMNIKAFKLGMYNTYFENASGLNDETSNYSTAYDLALLMKYAINNKDFLNITRTKKYNNWYNKNKLLTTYKYLISGKIGYTTKSGQVYVSAAKKNNKTLIIVSIDKEDKFNYHKKLYEKYFDEYNRYKILDKNTFNVLSKDKNNYYILNDFYMLLKKDELDKIKINIYLNDNDNYLEVLFNNKKIHTQKIYKVEYQERINKIKEILSFLK